MKKLIVSLLSVIMILGVTLPSYASASSLPSQANVSENQRTENSDQSFSDIKKIEKYVFVNEDGHIALNNKQSKSFHKKYNLDALETHFDELNKQVDDGTIRINEDLSIDDLSFNALVSYHKWDSYWWGKERNFTNSQAIRYTHEIDTVVAAGTIATASTATIPILGASIGATTGYYALLSARVKANNRGNGVYVRITYALVFNVKPL